MTARIDSLAMKLLFDFGGVLVDLDKQRCIDSFARLGFDIRPFLGTYRQAGPFSLLERGEISVPEFCNELRRLGCRAETDAEIVGAWEDYLTEVPTERLDMLLKIRQHYSVNCLSNTNEIHWHQAGADFFQYKGHGVGDFFDHVFLSCRLGLEKPAPELYAKVVEGLGVPAHEVLFFDDSEVNCEAARACGLQALLAPADSKWFHYFDENGKLHLP